MHWGGGGGGCSVAVSPAICFCTSCKHSSALSLVLLHCLRSGSSVRVSVSVSVVDFNELT